ncbi:GNAT family N-acetyltransferase [Neobacillus sp. D3-1R]|uniref:GNAT family N-acetyltransferase n=1 Tax=Neobacillus sp. D3-1R TaxID=3445778 RepID=UPI003F9F024D
MQTENKLDFVIREIEINDTEVAKGIILEGMKERFGFLDYSFNQDLNDIMKNYIEIGDTFLVGVKNEILVCTGALTKEREGVGRIQRMSVKQEYRGMGFARQMLQQLESLAIEKGYKKLLLETNIEWFSAIELYKSTGYTIYENEGTQSHFYKEIG